MMKKTSLFFAFCFLLCSAFAQWSTNANTPNMVAGFTGEQSIPKIAVTSDGHTYISRFDNNGGGYKVYLQLFTPDGYAVWTDPNGVLVSDHSQMTWITDYDMTVDSDGNAIVIFQDIRTAGVNNVVIYKISQTGTFLWGADGIALSSDTNIAFSNMSPVVFNSNDNSTYAAWQRYPETGYTTTVMQRLSAEGQKLWGENGIIVSALSASISWPQFIQSDADNVLLKYYYDTGTFPGLTRILYVAKYNTSGQRQWNTLMTDAGGYNAWQQTIPFLPDGSGGAIMAWYDDRENDWDYDVYCQRVDVSGAISMPADGALIVQDSVNQQFYPKLAVDPVNQQIFAFFRITDANQNLSGMGRQLLNYSGVMQWGNMGATQIEPSTTYVSVAGAYYTPQGAVCVYELGESVYAYCIRNGAYGWQNWPVAVSLLAGSNDDFVIDTHPDSWAVVAWSKGMSDMDIYAMRLNPKGTIGPEYLAPRDLTATLVPPADVTLTWVAPSLYVLPINYIVYMDNVLYQTLAGNVTTCPVPDLPLGEHQFYVIARYSGDHDSQASNIVTVIIVTNDDQLVPVIPVIIRVQPNPFSSAVSLSYALDKASSHCRISVFDLRGRLIGSLDADSGRGTHSIDLTNIFAKDLSAGIYFIRLETESTIRTVKTLRIK
jgi:hypothetical protein